MAKEEEKLSKSNSVKLTPAQALNYICLGLTTSGREHVYGELKGWQTDQLAAILLEALFQRNRLIEEKEERRTAKKENEDK